MDYRSVAIAKRVLKTILIGSGVRFTEANESINVRCPHCGDSKRSKSIKRGFFIFANVPLKGWMFYYKCQNGGCEFNNAISIGRYLSRFHPRYHDEYKALLKGEAVNPSQSFSSFDWKKMEEENMAQIAEETATRLAKEQKETDNFIPLNSVPESAVPRVYIDKAIRYCQSRMIPESIYMKFFVAVDGYYQDRLVVPFYRKDAKPSYFQCRALSGQEPKYLNRYGKKQFYNITFVDWSRIVIATEGAFDSMFIENAFALNGISSKSDDFSKIDKTRLFLLLDYDDAGAKQSREMIECGYFVFLWRKFITDNPVLKELIDEMVRTGSKPKLDWNDVCKALDKYHWMADELEPYFSRNPIHIPYIRGF